MFDAASLIRALPVSALEPNVLTRLTGWADTAECQAWQNTIALLEPPCGQREPYLDPVQAIEVLRLRAAPRMDAAELIASLRASLAPDRWVHFLDHLCPNTPSCIPIIDFIAALRQARHVEAGVIHFLENAAAKSASTPMFEGPDNRGSPWSLQTLPDPPPPKAMMEFLPGPAGGPWYFDIEWDWERGDWRQGFNPFAQWREVIRPTTEMLHNALGEPVYRFADSSCEYDDDDVHRFLVLHWCCTYRPQSRYVQYLVRTSGARNVEELKAALLDPAAYVHVFEMNGRFAG